MVGVSQNSIYDVAIIGGGINGCGCAADASIRGLSVILCEEDDLASKTSSSSTKLIHGGLRYLEHFDFSMVKKALKEREVLQRLAPHLVKPLGLVLPLKKGIRPAWMIRTGLFLYDHLSHHNSLPRSRLLNRKENSEFFLPLRDNFSKGFLYYDCTTDDARLTVTNAIQARNHGATILSRSKLIHAQITDGVWYLTLQTTNNPQFIIKAKSVINAAGPWVEPINQLLNLPQKHDMTLVKGSHFLVPKLYSHDYAYFLQHEDQRLIFIIPYHGYTMVGTTEVPVNNASRANLKISAEETRYLCDIVNQYFQKTIQPQDIVFSWSGVRPLLASNKKNSKELSRDFTFYSTQSPAPAVILCGGKITTYRQLAKKAVDELRSLFPALQPSSTHLIPLPGANFEEMDFAEYKSYAKQKYAWLPEELCNRWLNTYGTRMEYIVTGSISIADLGFHFGHYLYQKEVEYLKENEWACSTEDILWRRTKLGLCMNKEEISSLRAYLSCSQEAIY